MEKNKAISLSNANVFEVIYHEILETQEFNMPQSLELGTLEHDIIKKIDKRLEICFLEFESAIMKKAFYRGFGSVIVPDANTENCINFISSIVDSLKFIQLIDDIDLLDKYLHKLYEEWYQNGASVGNRLLEQLKENL